MTITAEQAQAELDRRAKAQAPSFSAGQAQAELERRQSAGAENQPGFLQQMFDVKNSNTGESYLYGNTPPPAPYEDLNRTVADTVSRGYLDKLQGPEAQAKTLAARERMPGWVETPTDIAAAVGSSPYRIGSMGVGALAGGLEGAASAYGHQEDWVPDAEGWKDIGIGTGVGVAAGAGGAKAGEWIGGKLTPKATEEPLTDAAGLAQREALDAQRKGFDDLAGMAGTQADDLAEQAARVAQIRGAQGSSRDALAKMMSGMEGASPETLYKAADITSKKGLVSKAGEVAESAGRQMPPIPLLLLETAAGHGIPWKTLAGMGAKKALSSAGKSDWANRVPAKAIEDLAVTESGGASQIDQATIDMWRDRLSKIAAGYGRSQ